MTMHEPNQEASSRQLLDYLRKCYTGSVAVLPPDHISLGNPWTRTRGAVFDSSVLNSGNNAGLLLVETGHVT